MNTVIVGSFIELIQYFEDVKQYKSLAFRGQADSRWKLLPKSGRPEFANHYQKSYSEKDAFNSWKRYAVHYIAKEPLNDWDWLALAQHHGLATRLLDWSKNPLVSTYFAVSDKFESDAAVYFFPIGKSVDPDKEHPFSCDKFSIYFPKGVSIRIINQRGLFTISNKPTLAIEEVLDSSLTKVIIKKEAKSGILESLSLYGINYLSVYQDLDSLSHYLNEYVKDLSPGRRALEAPSIPTDMPFG